jgi:hypothetical protein
VQGRLESLIEALTNTAIGFGINLAANMTVLPAMGLPVTLAQGLWIGVIFTVISVARSYVVRRWFQTHLFLLNKRLAARIQKALT